MKINCKSYMKGAEFLARQALFSFAEYSRSALDYLAEFRSDCRKGWENLIKKQPQFQEQLSLEFLRKIAEWANWTPEKNHTLFIHKIGA